MRQKIHSIWNSREGLRIAVSVSCLFLVAGCSSTQAVPETAAKPQFSTDAQDPKEFASAMIREFDYDEDGQLSEDEFARAAMAVFDCYDTNHDRVISASEAGQLWNGKSKEADVNGDGALSYEEIVQDQHKQFLHFDSNHDDELSLEELMLLVDDRLVCSKK